MKVTLDIPDQRVRDLLCVAWEGGSAYWATAKVIRSAPHKYVWEIPFNEGTLAIYDAETDEYLGLLSKTAIEKGLRLFATKYPEQFILFLGENDDADTGDVFLQCCVMGEVVYG